MSRRRIVSRSNVSALVAGLLLGPVSAVGCFSHQVLLRRDRHAHDRSSGPPARVSEHPHVA